MQHQLLCRHCISEPVPATATYASKLVAGTLSCEIEYLERIGTQRYFAMFPCTNDGCGRNSVISFAFHCAHDENPYATAEEYYTSLVAMCSS